MPAPDGVRRAQRTNRPEQLAAEDFTFEGQPRRTTTPKSASKHDLVVTRIIGTPAERAWKAWTDPEQVTRW